MQGKHDVLLVVVVHPLVISPARVGSISSSFCTVIRSIGTKAKYARGAQDTESRTKTRQKDKTHEEIWGIGHCDARVY